MVTEGYVRSSSLMGILRKTSATSAARFFTGWMPFLIPSQTFQRTESSLKLCTEVCDKNHIFSHM